MAQPHATEPPREVDSSVLHHMIEEAAYFRAQAHDFHSDPLEDWLAAEQEINQRVSPEAQEELAAYQRLRREAKRLFGEVRGAIDAETVKRVVDEAGREVKRLGEHTGPAVSRASRTLRKEIAAVSERLGPRWERFSDRTTDLFEGWRDRSSEFIGHAAEAVGDWVKGARKRRELQTFQSGEVAHAGTYRCNRCGADVTLGEASHLRDCRQCGGHEFTRV